MAEKPVKDKEPIMWALPLPVISGNGYGSRKTSLTWWAFCVSSRRALPVNLYNKMKAIKIVSLISFVILGTASTSFASVDKNLKYGQRDKEVTELQEFLIDKGFLKTSPSNFFGLLTLKAVKAYQTSTGVSSTGYVGVLTRQKINDEIAVDLASSNQAEIQETGSVSKSIDNTSAVTQQSVVQATQPQNNQVITPKQELPVYTQTPQSQPQVIVVQVQQPVIPVATSIPVVTEKLYKITKNGSVIKDNTNEQLIRDFMSDLTQYTNIKKHAMADPLFPVSEGDQQNIFSFLKANDYMLTEK